MLPLCKLTGLNPFRNPKLIIQLLSFQTLSNLWKPAGALDHLSDGLQGREGASLQLGEHLHTFWMRFQWKTFIFISENTFKGFQEICQKLVLPEHLQRKPQRLSVAAIEQSESEGVL